MQKIIIVILFFFISFCSFASALTNDEYISALEKRLFGITYDKEKISKRIDRIEMHIYDNSYSGSIEERLEKIDKIYPKYEFETNAIATSTPVSSDYYQEYPINQEESDYNNYPIVNEIEQHIYNHNYSGEDIYKRLNRLEKELYGVTKNEESLQERVESLKAVLPKKHYEKFASKELGFEDFGLKTPSEYQNKSQYSNSDIVAQLELNAFNKVYDNDNMDKRLGRLEHYYFGGITNERNEMTRLNRLASVAMSSKNMNEYFPTPKGAQWVGILMNLLVFGLGFLL